jgi:hypothetical protein
MYSAWLREDELAVDTDIQILVFRYWRAPNILLAGYADIQIFIFHISYLYLLPTSHILPSGYVVATRAHTHTRKDARTLFSQSTSLINLLNIDQLILVESDLKKHMHVCIMYCLKYQQAGKYGFIADFTI